MSCWEMLKWITGAGLCTVLALAFCILIVVGIKTLISVCKPFENESKGTDEST